MARQQNDDTTVSDGPDVVAPVPDGDATLAETPTVAQTDEQARAATPSGGRTVKSKTPYPDADVTVTLAHPMDAARAQHLGLEVADNEALPPGTQITLHRNYARALINSGYIAIDPEDTKAVTEALRVS